jgi:hypothetical protein
VIVLARLAIEVDFEDAVLAIEISPFGDPASLGNLSHTSWVRLTCVIARYEIGRLIVAAGLRPGEPRGHARRAKVEPESDGRHRGGAIAVRTPWILLLGMVAGITACHQDAAAPRSMTVPVRRSYSSTIPDGNARDAGVFAGAHGRDRINRVLLKSD